LADTSNLGREPGRCRVSGAIEDAPLDKLRLVPVYVRSNGETSKGLESLRHKGALPWPNPQTPEALANVLAVEIRPGKSA
jgi:hypothetical protein